MGTNPDSLTLRQLSLPTRLVLSLFLVSVGFGYFSALVQLHFNGGAKAGEPLPDMDDAVSHYGGQSGVSELERIIAAPETKPFNASGSMAAAFTTRSSSWVPQLIARAKDRRKVVLQGGTLAETFVVLPGAGDPIAAVARLTLDADAVLPPDGDDLKQVLEKEPSEDELADAVQKARAERELERRAMIEWIQAGADKKTYAAFPLSKVLAAESSILPDDNKFIKVERSEDGKVQKATGNIAKIMDARCERCHNSGAGGPAGEIHLDQFEVVKCYATPGPGNSAMSLNKLAQSTHVHLLGFSMLYGLTGLIFSFTSYPSLIRSVFGPLTLIAQLADISCWWLARADPNFAKVIVVTGGFVAIGLAVQIIGGLFDMYNLKGKIILFILIVVTALGGGTVLKTVVSPHLEKEKAAGSHL